MSLHQMALFARDLSLYDGRLSLPVFSPLITDRASQRILANSLIPDDGSPVPTTERAEQGCLLAKRGHRGHEPREGGLQHYASQGCFWLRRRTSHND